jgi:voltage-gated potassium channel
MKLSSRNNLKSLWRSRLHEIIFEADTPGGKAFDVILIWSIIISVITVILESVSGFRSTFGHAFYTIEWFFTILFTIEYALRLISVGRPISYAASFYGIVDFLAVIPTYISIFIPGSHYLLAIRVLRLLRIFRVFKLTSYLREAKVITTALRASRRKISVFLLAVLTVVVVIGAMMYVIEGETHGFSDIPISIYWAIVTLTTVGYGDLSPQTPIGKALASLVMVLGYGIIAVPTGIVTVEMSTAVKKAASTQACRQCSAEGHDIDAEYCKYCGARL